MKNKIVLITLLCFASCKNDDKSPFESKLSTKYSDTASIYFNRMVYHVEYTDCILPNGYVSCDSSKYYADLYRKYSKKSDSVKAFIELN